MGRTIKIAAAIPLITEKPYTLTEEELTIFSEKVRSVTRFFSIKKLRDRDINYTGRGVKFGDVEKPVIRWQLNSKTFRVIYGDLSMKDVAQENLLK